MRCLLAVLLGLSLPAYAAVNDWHIKGAVGTNGTIAGTFTVGNGSITEWDIAINPPGREPVSLKPYCFKIPPANQCDLPFASALILSDEHLQFRFDSSPGSTLILDLLLAAPFGANPNQLISGSEFSWDYLSRHDAITGVITAPEPSVFVLVLFALLGCKLWKRNGVP